MSGCHSGFRMSKLSYDMTASHRLVLLLCTQGPEWARQESLLMGNDNAIVQPSAFRRYSSLARIQAASSCKSPLASHARF